MKRMIAMVVVLLCVTAVVQAEMAVYAEVTYPSSTTWRLFLTECDWDGVVANVTPSGFGICSIAIDVDGVTSAGKQFPSFDVFLINDDYEQVGIVGFPGGPTPATVTAGVAQAFANQDTQSPVVLFRGFGVSAGSYVPPDGWSTTGAYTWPAPGAPGTASPGVRVFGGKRVAEAEVSIVWGERAKANVFTSDSGVDVTTVDVVPEPATLALLMLGGLAALRRRR